MAMAPRLGTSLLDLDVATGPLTRVVSDLTGVRHLDDPVLAGLTRDARYDTLLGLAEANLRVGRPVVLVAPFTAERARPSAWATITRRILGDLTMVWLHLPPDELVQRLTRRALAHDENKIRDPGSFLTGLDLEPPVVPDLALDASPEMSVVLASVFVCHGTVCSPRSLRKRCWGTTAATPGTCGTSRQKAGLNRGILRSGWGLLVRRLEDKAPGRVEKVKPHFTSQRCSACGHVDAESRESQARFVCTACGFACNADVNAARNIAAGHAVTARGGDGVARPVNREPHLLLQSV